MPEGQFNVANEALNDLGQRIMEVPAVSARDVVAKVISWTGGGDYELPRSEHPFWAEARALIG